MLGHVTTPWTNKDTLMIFCFHLSGQLAFTRIEKYILGFKAVRWKIFDFNFSHKFCHLFFFVKFRANTYFMYNTKMAGWPGKAGTVSTLSMYLNWPTNQRTLLNGSWSCNYDDGVSLGLDGLTGAWQFNYPACSQKERVRRYHPTAKPGKSKFLYL